MDINDSVKKAIIIGNGISRKSFDLEKIKELNLGSIFGCNALYRDFWPDWLIAIDMRMCHEILLSDYPRERFICPPIDEQFEPAEYNPGRPRENAGMIAMKEAIKKGYNYLYCFGIDFLIESGVSNIQNVYENTHCYGPETQSTFNDLIARSMYFDWFASKNPDVIFDFVYPESLNITFRNLKSTNIKGSILKVST